MASDLKVVSRKPDDESERTEPLMQTDTDSRPNRAMDPTEWVDQHGDYLYRYAIRNIHRADVAEDLVQETLLAALKGRTGYSGRASERTWLTAILKRKVIDWLRRAIQERTASAELGSDQRANDPFDRREKWRVRPKRWTTGAPSTELERKEFWAVIRGCSGKLAPRLRQVFLLWYLEERSADAICQAIGITPTNLWVMLHRSRLGMWQCLTTNWYGQPTSERTKGG
jgi:RNA polymerase sigma-70 factor (TIGR02943 family)